MHSGIGLELITQALTFFALKTCHIMVKYYILKKRRNSNGQKE